MKLSLSSYIRNPFGSFALHGWRASFMQFDSYPPSSHVWIKPLIGRDIGWRIQQGSLLLDDRMMLAARRTWLTALDMLDKMYANETYPTSTYFWSALSQSTKHIMEGMFKSGTTLLFRGDQGWYWLYWMGGGKALVLLLMFAYRCQWKVTIGTQGIRWTFMLKVITDQRNERWWG